MSESDSSHLRETIKKLRELPPMPVTGQKILDALKNDDIGLAELAHIIEQDPSLLARIIGLANSAYFGTAEQVTSAEEAVIKVLGLNTTKSIALSVVLNTFFDTRRCPHFPLEKFWLLAVFTGSLAQRLAPLMGTKTRPTPGEAYLAGMLVCFGLLALVHLYPETIDQAFVGGSLSEQPELMVRERELLGVDHTEVGGWLARHWHLPRQVIDVIEYYHRPEGYEGGYAPLVKLTALCIQCAENEVLGDGCGGPGADQWQALGMDPRQCSETLEAVRGKLAQLWELAAAIAHS